MTEQAWGFVAISIGVYLFICANWWQSFFFYRMKIARFVGLFGEKAARVFYSLFGFACVAAGTAKALGYY